MNSEENHKRWLWLKRVNPRWESRKVVNKNWVNWENIERPESFNELMNITDDVFQCVYIRGSLNKFPDFFRMGTFIDITHMKLYSPSKRSPPAAMYLLYRSNNLWKAPWTFSCVSVSMNFVTASFISSILL